MQYGIKKPEKGIDKYCICNYHDNRSMSLP
jgi:hypothetical protein